MQGLEFMVGYDPLQAATGANAQFMHEPSNIWVIRKQTRRKRSGYEDEVVVLATFFVVNDCIYMAPSAASVIGNRIVRPSELFVRFQADLCFCSFHQLLHLRVYSRLRQHYPNSPRRTGTLIYHRCPNLHTQVRLACKHKQAKRTHQCLTPMLRAKPSLPPEQPMPAPQPTT